LPKYQTGCCKFNLERSTDPRYCDDAPVFSPLKVVEIDECPGCAGIWLDSGELAKIHENHLTPKERKLLAHEMATNHGFITIKSPKSKYYPKAPKNSQDTTVERLVQLALLNL